MWNPNGVRKIGLTSPGFSANTTAFEFRNHLAARKPSEIASVAGTIGKLVGDGFERLAGFDSLLDDADRGQRGFLGVIFVDVLDDVRGANGFRDRHSFAMVAIIIDHIFIARRRDAAGVANRQALDAELQLGLGGVASRFLDHLGRHRLGVGERGLAQQNPFDDVIARPFLRARFDGGGMLARHGFGEAQTKRANLIANHFVFDQFVVDS